MGELDAGDDKLDAEHEAGEIEVNELEVLLRVESILHRPDPVGAMRGEGNASKEGYHFVIY